jgi:hypothetical protein
LCLAKHRQAIGYITKTLCTYGVRVLLVAEDATATRNGHRR